MHSHEPKGGYPARPGSFSSHFQAPVAATPSRDTGCVKAHCGQRRQSVPVLSS
jgi:hypothetical protein